jgi:hypothetical protein
MHEGRRPAAKCASVRHGCRWHSHGDTLNMVTTGHKHWLIIRPQTTWPSTWPSVEADMPMHAWLDAAAAEHNFRNYWSQYLWRCVWLGSESNQRRSRHSWSRIRGDQLRRMLMTSQFRNGSIPVQPIPSQLTPLCSQGVSHEQSESKPSSCVTGPSLAGLFLVSSGWLPTSFPKMAGARRRLASWSMFPIRFAMAW